MEAPGVEAPRSSTEGACRVERRRREGEVWEGGVPLPTGGGVWVGAVPFPRKCFNF